MIGNIATMPMENYAFDTVQLMRQTIDQIKKDSSELGPNSPWASLKAYSIDISFDAVTDRSERHFLENLGTNYDLSADAVDRLRKAAGEILTQSNDFKLLLGRSGHTDYSTHWKIAVDPMAAMQINPRKTRRSGIGGGRTSPAPLWTQGVGLAVSCARIPSK